MLTNRTSGALTDDDADDPAGASPGGWLASTAQNNRLRRAASGVGAVLLFYFVQQALWPAPAGILLRGAIYGGFTALLAIGLALVYRANRIVNFAQSDLGVLPASVGVLLVARNGWPYPVAFVFSIALAMVVGVIVQRVFVKRFFKAPRLILTVVTLGVSQLLAGVAALVTNLMSAGKYTNIKPPFSFRFSISPVTFTAFHLVAAIAAPCAVLGLLAFLRYTSVGIAIRASAENADRAGTLGIPVERVQTIVWAVAAALSALSVFLLAGVTGVLPGITGAASGSSTFMRALAAAVVGRMERFGLIVGAAVAIGVIDQAVIWHTQNGLLVDPIIFLVILGSLFVQRRGQVSRAEEGETSSWRAVAEARPVPAELAELSEVVWAKRVLIGVVVAVALAVPWLFGPGRTNLAALVLVYTLLALSLVVLTGWAGQVSLGQVAFMGIGAAVSGAITIYWHWDLLLGSLVAALVGALAAVVVGLPALRIKGLFLAVTTFGLSVTVANYLLRSDVVHWVPASTDTVARLPLLNRLVVDSERRYYYVCLAFTAIGIAMVRGMRRSRTGRALMGMRDNERSAQSYGINAARAKLTAFAMSGAMASVAGALFIHHQQTLDLVQFAPGESLRAFTMVVIGGLGSIPGAVFGALYLNGIRWFVDLLPKQDLIRTAFSFLGTGVGLIAILALWPAGLGSLLFRARDRSLRMVAARRGLVVPSLVADVATRSDVPPRVDAISTSSSAQMDGAPPLLAARALDAGYDGVQVLFGVEFEVHRGQIVALLGTNGAGKSTFLRTLTGLLPPTSGDILLEGEALEGRPDQIAARGVALVAGGAGVFPTLTVAENLRIAGWLFRRDKERLDAAIDDALDHFPRLRERLNTSAGNLSGGEQQMLTLAQSFMGKPRLLLIDELSLGLAPIIVEQLVEAVKSFRDEDTTVVLVEQSVNVALTVADEAYFMEKGEIRFRGRAEELLERPDVLRSVFIEGATSETGPSAAQPAVAKKRRASLNGSARHVLEVESVAKSFGGIRAIEDISIQLEAGQILGILGPNGSGKTTLFDIISGFLLPDDGTVTLDGFDITTASPDRRARLGLGRSFQDARLFPSLTVADTIALALERSIEMKDPLKAALNLPVVALSEQRVARRVEELIELMGLEAYRDKFIHELSTGTRRMVDLTCTLAHRPSVLLLDEPSSGIAQRETEALAPLIRRIQSELNFSLIVIEHDMPLLCDLSDEVVAMGAGHVLTRGEPDAVLRDPRVVASYLGSSDDVVKRSGARKRRARVGSSRS